MMDVPLTSMDVKCCRIISYNVRLMTKRETNHKAGPFPNVLPPVHLHKVCAEVFRGLFVSVWAIAIRSNAVWMG